MDRLIALISLCFCVSANSGTLATAVAAWTNGPFIAYTGDSIAEGHYLYHSIQHLGPNGDTNANIASVVYYASTNVVTGTNYGHGGQTFKFIITADIVSALATRPKYLFVHCGVNDISTSQTWEQTVSNLNNIKTRCTESNAIVILDDVFPWSNGSDAQAITVRTWNTNFSTWAATSTVYRLTSHDSMGQTRISTGELDDLKTAYDDDGVHITTNGYAAWSSLILTRLLELETTPSASGATIRADNMRSAP